MILEGIDAMKKCTMILIAVEEQKIVTTVVQKIFPVLQRREVAAAMSELIGFAIGKNNRQETNFELP